ncbi:MAG: acyl-CoA dehydrogenase family protein [Cytophagales bacterium]|nr:acyl-CoA dehydrogenase family protein [Cytophagales bacterium]
MDFNFSEDQEQLRETVKRWVSKDYTFERRNQIIAAGKGKGGFDAASYEGLASLGLCGLNVPEAHDGLGMGAVDTMIVMEELGRGMVMEPLAQTLIASRVLASVADQAMQAAWLPKLASGEVLLALAYQESASRYKLDACQATASKASSGYMVSGKKALVAAGDQVTGYIVSAKLDGKLALFLAERSAAGVKTTPVGLQDGSRAAEVRFDNAPAALITPDGLAALELAVDTGISLLCAEAVGVMETTLAMTVDYMNTRKQFGQTLSMFQALRHRVADMKMQLELARSMSYYAALKMETPAAERRACMARAKYQLGQSMRFVGQSAVQLHGGIGVTDEYMVSHCFKKLTQLEMTFGDSLHHLGEVSDRMHDTAGVFA